MKKLQFVLLGAVAVWGLQACNSTPKDSKATADSVNEKKVDAAKDTSSKDTSKMSAMSATPVEKDDTKFATEAASGGMTEVALGKLASDKGVSAKVKSFGMMMVTDHTMANNKMMELAKQKNITLPTAPSTDDQKTIDDLSKKTGADFDKAYVSAMVDDHKKDIKLFEDEVKNTKDADIKAFASKTLPTLGKHLEAIKVIQAGMK